MALSSAAPPGEGSAAGERAGEGASASGGAEEAALRAGGPRGGRWGRRRRLPAPAPAHLAGLVGGGAGLPQRAALPQHAELLAEQQPLLAGHLAALRPPSVLPAGQQLLTGLRRLPALRPPPGLHPLPALHLAPHPELPEAAVHPALLVLVHRGRLAAALAFPPAQSASERPVRGQVHLQEVQHLHQVGKPAEERGKCLNSLRVLSFCIPGCSVSTSV